MKKLFIILAAVCMVECDSSGSKNWEAEYEECEYERENLEQQISELEEQVSDLEQQVSDLEDEKEEIQDQLNDAEDVIDRAKYACMTDDDVFYIQMILNQY